MGRGSRGNGGVLLVCALAWSAGCVHARDFRAPAERLTPNTAYAEHARVRVDAGLLGPDVQTLALNAGLTVAAVRDHLDFSINFAHGAIGMVSLQSKFMVVDTRWYGLGGQVGFDYLNPRTLWFLPKELRAQLGDINVISLPIEVWNSFPVARWFAFHLGLIYQQGLVWGSLGVDDLLADANFTRRSFGFSPVLNFFIAERVALTAGARLLAFAQSVSEVDVEVEVTPDLKAGVRSVEWFDRSFADSVRLSLGAQTRFGKNTHMRLAVHFGAYRPIERLTVSPSLSFYWRFK